MSLNNLKPAAGSKFTRKRVGRGPGSGNGKTAGRGHKGAQSRSGYSYKRGFNNIFRIEYEVVNLDQLEERFDAGTTVTPDALRAVGLVRVRTARIKVLARGEVTKALTVQVHKFSGKAADKIAAAGGRAEAIS